MEFYNRGNAKLNKQDYQGALADYTETITRNPKYADAYYLRGLARVELHDYQAALADYRKAADLYQQQGKTSDYQDTLRRIEELQR
jgi:tetratricopeptide (TPR) repeat protein